MAIKNEGTLGKLEENGQIFRYLICSKSGKIFKYFSMFFSEQCHNEDMHLPLRVPWPFKKKQKCAGVLGLRRGKKFNTLILGAFGAIFIKQSFCKQFCSSSALQPR